MKPLDFDQMFASLRLNLDPALQIQRHFEQMIGGQELKVHQDHLLNELETKRKEA